MKPTEPWCGPRAVMALLAAIVSASPAVAQSLTDPLDAPGVFAAERLSPATDREGIFDAESGTVHKHLDYDVALWGMYALNPLSAWRIDADGSVHPSASVVSHRVGANVIAQLALFDWVALGIDIPVALLQLGGSGVPHSLNPGAPALMGLGDIRMVPKIRLLRAEDAGLNVALLPSFTVHTAFPANGYLGEGFYTFQPRVAFSREWQRFRLASDVGLLLRADKTLLERVVGPQFTYRVGVGYKLHPLDIPVGIDIGLSGSAQITPKSEEPAQQPLEALLGAYWDIWGPLQAFAGAGARVLIGPSAPDLRVFAGARWAPRDGDGDSDGDGIGDDVDACPDQAEDKDGYQDSDGCPDDDNDGDGIADAADKCPDQPEDKDGFEDDDGCPDVDNDGDGIADAADQCPDQPEDKDGFQDEDGCPDNDSEDDRDSDGIPDAVDKCPLEPETINGVDDEDGCPDAGKQVVSVTQERIEIQKTIFFETGNAVIQERSHSLLKQVASVLRANPQIKKVSIDGHTDSQGNPARNKQLSEERAKSVRQFLIEQGISADRLTAAGHGSEKPLADNATWAGRSKNRRVEFNIVDPPPVAQPVPPATPAPATPAPVTPSVAPPAGEP